jgi:predicted GNAT family acetyltransferase
MVLDASQLADRVNAETEIVPLGPADVPQMLALVETAKPGPFASRTIELGIYVGVRDGGAGRLIAMGGLRLQLDHHVELSAIAVHPEARGQGLGAAITAYLARAVVARGRMPFLHVYPDNPVMALYARLGFRERARLWVLQRRPVRT